MRRGLWRRRWCLCWCACVIGGARQGRMGGRISNAPLRSLSTSVVTLLVGSVRKSSLLRTQARTRLIQTASLWEKCVPKKCDQGGMWTATPPRGAAQCEFAPSTRIQHQAQSLLQEALRSCAPGVNGRHPEADLPAERHVEHRCGCEDAALDTGEELLPHSACGDERAWLSMKGHRKVMPDDGERACLRIDKGDRSYRDSIPP